MTLIEVLVLLFGVFLAAGFLLFLVRDYRKISSVERLALWWWATVSFVGLVALTERAHLVLGLDGLLMIGLGLFVALDVRGIADRLGRRRTSIGLWAMQSAASWRFGGLALIVIGSIWALSLSN